MKRDALSERQKEMDGLIKKASIKRLAYNPGNGGYDCFINGKLTVIGVSRALALEWYNE